MLPQLHRLVLGIESSSLEEKLQKQTTQIHAQDRLGYTATGVGQLNANDIYALRLLLRYRADPEVCD